MAYTSLGPPDSYCQAPTCYNSRDPICFTSATTLLPTLLRGRSVSFLGTLCTSVLPDRLPVQSTLPPDLLALSRSLVYRLFAFMDITIVVIPRLGIS